MHQKKTLILISCLLLGLIIALYWPGQTPSSDATSSSPNMVKLTPVEVNKQTKMAIAELLQNTQPEAISAQAALLRELMAAPALSREDRASRLEKVAALEKGRLTLLSQQHSLVQERDALMAKWQQGNLAIEMLVSPQSGADAYLDGIYKQYKQYAQTIDLILKNLYEDTSVAAQQQAHQRLLGMVPTAEDNIRVLSLEMATLRDNMQAKAGMSALQELVKSEQGLIPRWIWLHTQQSKLQALADELQQQVAG